MARGAEGLNSYGIAPLSCRDSPPNHKIHDVVRIDVIDHDIRMLVLEDPKHLINKALPDRLNPFEVEDNVLKLFKLKKHPLGLRTRNKPLFA